jgi:hypothetical protein
LEDAAGHLTARRNAHNELWARVRHIEDQLDTLGSPLWKRVLFRADGYEPWYVVDPRRRWRPWHRWFYLIGPEDRALIYCA